jgi:L-ascorbate metabolism protein UlaG (beta-lactamase superfamily)
MKITKLNHSCVLVEMPAPTNRTALFDPGEMSGEAIEAANLEYLDDIFITHEHFDHFSADLIKKLVQKFPDVRITAPQSVVTLLKNEHIEARTAPPEGAELFHAPHEQVEPLFPTPDEAGVHYLDSFTHPGDSLHFDDSKSILALPVEGPWGTTVDAIKLAVKLQPQYVLPIHDAMWTDDWRQLMYGRLEELFNEQGITFYKWHNGEPVVIDSAVATREPAS